MLQKLKKVYFQIFKQFPENRIHADYFEMLDKLKQLEDQVETRAKQLEMAKASFLRNLYHEIRTPLNAIIGFTHLLSAGKPLIEEDKEEYLQVVNQSSTDFLKVMDDIIQASLLEAGMIKINNEDFRLSDFMNEVYSFGNLRKHVLEKDQVALLKNITKEMIDVSLVCDKYYLTQILNQLIDNAIKFTDRGTVEFGCEFKNQSIVFYVKDTGNGNINGKGKYIFDKFTKVNSADGSKKGLGIGLSNCKNLAELMNGKIWYTSKVKKGSCFYFGIPYVTAESGVEKNKTDEKTQGFLESVFRGQKSYAV